MDLREESRDVLIDVICYCNSTELYKEGHFRRKDIILRPITHTRKIWNSVKIAPIFYAFSNRFSVKELMILLKTMRRTRYDLIVLDHSQLFIYGLFIRRVPKIAISHDVITQRIHRQGNYLKYLHSRITESILIRLLRDTRFYTFSKKDKLYLKNLGANEVFTTSFYPNFTVSDYPSLENAIVLFASWSRPENIEGLRWFVESVLPFIRLDIQVKVLGGGLPNKDIDRLKTHSNVKYLGFVDDPAVSIASSMLLIAPIFQGAGVKVKVVDALSLGTPVLGTKMAFEGINFELKGAMQQAKTKKEFINRINSCEVDLSFKYKLKEEFWRKYFNYNLRNDILNYVER